MHNTELPSLQVSPAFFSADTSHLHFTEIPMTQKPLPYQKNCARNAYESENFGPEDFKYGPTSRRYSLMLDLVDQLGIRREPKLSLYGNWYMDTRNSSRKDFIYWVIYHPGVEQVLMVQTEEQRLV
ncbi:hypothetical protein MPER_05688 [Moniliophthora perniciosa FA553]|nr:hypothetical protein MPER_05688 [Moniliophthora perniciosa FA553]